MVLVRRPRPPHTDHRPRPPARPRPAVPLPGNRQAPPPRRPSHWGGGGGAARAAALGTAWGPGDSRAGGGAAWAGGAGGGERKVGERGCCGERAWGRLFAESRVGAAFGLRSLQAAGAGAAGGRAGARTDGETARPRPGVSEDSRFHASSSAGAPGDADLEPAVDRAGLRSESPGGVRRPTRPGLWVASGGAERPHCPAWSWTSAKTSLHVPGYLCGLRVVSTGGSSCRGLSWARCGILPNAFLASAEGIVVRPPPPVRRY
ncbi:uncharacterized PE-PGRS family protein PE_PGRS3-like [Lutra lutra]|uniref:uncharacterized PE-PGRS family protein PE_PGRS3-like n=1 Tax=Lutra lutra TaxID=9657 RepID=UPI001FD13159|nr:uncharacterized PE-PGRS family protein PE_PGRS3-like [Lutra lutra]